MIPIEPRPLRFAANLRGLVTGKEPHAKTRTLVLPWRLSHAVARFLNRIGAVLNATGFSPTYMVTLEVVGRKSGKAINLPQERAT